MNQLKVYFIGLTVLFCIFGLINGTPLNYDLESSQTDDDVLKKFEGDELVEFFRESQDVVLKTPSQNDDDGTTKTDSDVFTESNGYVPSESSQGDDDDNANAEAEGSGPAEPSQANDDVTKRTESVVASELDDNDDDIAPETEDGISSQTDSDVNVTPEAERSFPTVSAQGDDDVNFPDGPSQRGDVPEYDDLEPTESVPVQHVRPTSCEAENGSFHYGSDCTEYYQCYDNIRYYGKCQSGLLFDVDKKRCEWKRNVQCPI